MAKQMLLITTSLTITQNRNNMNDIREIINSLSLYDSCTRLTPQSLAKILQALLDLTDSTELSELTAERCALPKLAGIFSYEGLPVHTRAIYHSSNYYIIFCTCHKGTSGNLGEKYLVFKRDAEGVYLFETIYTSSNVTDWVKRAFNECTATNNYPGLLSALMYKRLNAVYDWCVNHGMPSVS